MPCSQFPGGFRSRWTVIAVDEALAFRCSVSPSLQSTHWPCAGAVPIADRALQLEHARR
jgi:hypothetical protein